MTFTYNLLNEQWIPCIMPDGSPKEFSIRNVISKAHEIKEIFDPSPLITAALHRLLLAILYRIYEPKNLNDWKKLWGKKEWNMQKAEEYFSKWEDMFDLFDKDYPFMQVNDFKTKSPTPIKKLALEFSTGSSTGTLFDHSYDKDMSFIPVQIIGKWIVATQAFSPHETKGKETQTEDSPWSRSAIAFIDGNSLFETLALNLLSLTEYSFTVENERQNSKDDTPFWEKKEGIKPLKNVVPKGINEYMSWISRQIKVIPVSENGAVGCKECYLGEGLGLDKKIMQQLFDPMLTYQKDDKYGFVPLRLQKERAIWRDSDVLFQLDDNNISKRPHAFNMISRLVTENIIPRNQKYRLKTYGVILEKAKPCLWRSEKIPLVPEYLDNKELVGKIRTALDVSSRVAEILSDATLKLAKQIDNNNKKSEFPERFVKNIRPSRLYWSDLELPFLKFLEALPSNSNTKTSECITRWENELIKWAITVRKIALNAFLSMASGIGATTRILKAVVLVEGEFRMRLNEIIKPYKEALNESAEQ